MANSYSKGDKVSWSWGKGTAEGKVEEKFERRVQRTIKGSKIVRNGSKENPAYLIVQEDGDKVLKEGSELH
ncbi:DUF2945 domain-containing protein [Sphingomonas sp. MJ1 (PH-R8)]|uniref:DUF2945 domain-containing protein n=1 Tax=unclassified Sphingomonas TaxID=196159 RepID=UPI001EF412A4|nr:DUF2945 domain-containing protein [Sphingomonas sp. ACRSK]MCG7348634.1 DUF2945 domain-containing protein [Sphingomonas sp. ACRSK]